MSRAYEELDRRATPMGELVLRRRLEPVLQIDVFEVILGEEHLMSSLFTAAEIALADLGLAAAPDRPLDVVVGGLGLGYTAVAALRDERVASLRVVEALDVVIGWHEQRLLPFAEELVDDARCRLVHADFFALVAGEETGPMTEPVDVVLLDIDHTPRHHLHPSHAAFYTQEGTRRLAARLRPGGVFALWSDDPPDDASLDVAGTVFGTCEAHVVRFPNPHTGGEGTNTVYVCTDVVER
jgi:spermidine synthase